MPVLRRKAEDAASALPALMIKAERAAQNIFHGEHAQRKSGAGEKFWQFREYTPQDRPQDIDWRQSGKTDRVFIRQKERQLPQTALFWTCTHESMNFSSSTKIPKKSEAANVLTLALGLLMTHGGERVGMLGTPQTGRSETSLENIGNFLLNPTTQEALPLAGPGKSLKNSMLVLVGDFLNPLEEIEATLENLAAQASGGFVIQILDPAEIDLPWDGRVIFEDGAQAQREIIQNVSSIRAAYKQRIENHTKEVKRVSNECGWNYIFHVTNKDYQETLMDVWTAMNGNIHRGAP